MIIVLTTLFWFWVSYEAYRQEGRGITWRAAYVDLTREHGPTGLARDLALLAMAFFGLCGSILSKLIPDLSLLVTIFLLLAAWFAVAGGYFALKGALIRHGQLAPRIYWWEEIPILALALGVLWYFSG